MGSRSIGVTGSASYHGNLLYSNLWALVVGANHYEEERIPDLQYAERDAQEVAALLPSLGFPPANVRLLLAGREPLTRQRILDALEEDLNPRMDNDDRLLLYFAGHGVTTEVGGERRGYLLLPSSRIHGPWPSEDRPFLARPPVPAIEMEGLLHAVKGLMPKHKLVLMDACCSGFIAQARELSGEVRANDPRLALWTSSRVTEVLTAGQRAFEKDQYGHGVFTHHLLKGLEGHAGPRGDGLITFSELAAFVNSRVAAEGVNQDPQSGQHGEGEFVFLRAAAAPPRVVVKEVTGWLVVNCREEAELYADGLYVQRLAPEQRLRMPLLEGRHRVRAQQGTRQFETVVKIREDGETRLDLELPRPEPQAGEAWRSPSTGIEFVWIPAGEFDMGSESKEAHGREKPVHRVRISRGFWMGKYPVTQAQWEKVMGENPSCFKGADRPVEDVSWNEVQEFLKKLSARGEGRFRLPTEAEWEYAARAGSREDRYGPVEEIGWYDRNSGGETHPVGQKQPNAWGLYDMLGNVWDWCQDWYGGYPAGTVMDPQGPGSGKHRVLRGGSWFNFPRDLRASVRDRLVPGWSYNYLGFRCVRE